jgi:hypothetical protein
LDEFNPFITLVSHKEVGVANGGNHPGPVALDLFSEVARIIKQQAPFSWRNLEWIASQWFFVPICSLLAATLHKLGICSDQQVESLTEEEEKALQLLTSLQTLEFMQCPGLLSLPQGLHSLSSLKNIEVLYCPEIKSLPKGHLPLHCM